MNQRNSHRFRITYAKEGKLVYTSHRDLIQLLMRAFRRAGLPIFYTQGFSPRPKTSFAPPLPLGIAGTGELADVELTRHQDEQGFLEALKDSVPDGLRFISGENLLPGAPSLSRLITGSCYLLTPTEESGKGLDTDEILSRKNIVIERIRKKDKEPKSIDIRPLLHSLSRKENGTVYAKVAAAPSTIPPAELVRLVWPDAKGKEFSAVKVVRLGFIAHSGLALF